MLHFLRLKSLVLSHTRIRVKLCKITKKNTFMQKFYHLFCVYASLLFVFCNIIFACLRLNCCKISHKINCFET